MRVRINANPENKKNILTLLEEQNYSLPCNCHGARRCNGKNYSFDCSMVPTSPLEVELPGSSYAIQSIAMEDRQTGIGPADTLLIDLGTTTLALALMDKKSGTLRFCSTSANPQISCGADVIARIQAACSGSLSDMQRSIQNHLEKETALLCQKNHQDISSIRFCYIGGNTTMIHLLMGYDCTSLGHSPFSIRVPSPTSFTKNNCLITIAPWISAFVGGDITAGLSACDMQTSRSTSLFVDLGTNGEMVLCHNGLLYTAATAAGPALEGGGLSCGCPGIPGAIHSVRLRKLRPALVTIGNKLPAGLCGSGAISLCAELIRKKYITKDGILTDLFPAEGILLTQTPQGIPLRFTADDLRNIQLAVAAIAAGIDTLLHVAGISSSSVNTLFLGGGFGFHLAPEDCATLGLFSDIPVSRIKAMGNTCLEGLYKHALSGAAFVVPKDCRTLNLAENADFQHFFIKHMVFP